MARFDQPLQDLAADTKAYVDLQADDLKLKVSKGLSLSLGQLLALLLVVLSLFIVLLSVAAGCVLLIGQWTGSYALGAFVMAGSFAIVTAVLFLLRKKLFVDSFVRLFTGIFFEEEEETA